MVKLSETYNLKVPFVIIRKTVFVFSVFRVQLVNIAGDQLYTFIEKINYAMPVQKKGLNIAYVVIGNGGHPC